MKNKYPKLSAILFVIASIPYLCDGSTLIHRYEFSNNLNDSVGTIAGTATGNGINTEAPSYVTAAPTGATGLSTSIFLGQNSDTKKSGFALTNSVLDHTSGSLSLWLNRATAVADGNADYIIYQPNFGDGMQLYIPDPGNNPADLRSRLGGSSNILAENTLAPNNWTHVVLTWDSNGTELYINGSSTGTGTLANFTATASLRFGNFDFGGSGYLDTQYSGYIYDIQSYAGALTSEEVSYLFSNPGTAIPEPSQSAWGLAAILLMVCLLARQRKKA